MATNEAGYEHNLLMHSFVFTMKHSVVSSSLARRFMVPNVVPRGWKFLAVWKLSYTIWCTSVFDRSRLDASRVNQSHDVLVTPCINATLKGDSAAVLTSDDTQQAALKCLIKNCRTPTKRSTRRRKRSLMQARFDAAYASSDNIPNNDTGSDCKYFFFRADMMLILILIVPWLIFLLTNT